MERDYADGVRKDVLFFTGTEVENTPQKGAKTLFVVGVHPPDDIAQRAKQASAKHIYLGANQSFNVAAYDDATGWDRWDGMASALLERGYWVTLDFDMAHWPGVLEMRANEHAQFIPQVSVKLPHVGAANYNTCIKIDDVGFKASNPGVWVHSLHDLTGRSAFTPWDSYGEDTEA